MVCGESLLSNRSARYAVGGIGGGKVGRGMCYESHGKNYHKDVKPDRGAGKEAVALQCTNLVEDAATGDFVSARG